MKQVEVPTTKQRAHKGLKGLIAHVNDHFWNIRKQDKNEIEKVLQTEQDEYQDDPVGFGEKVLGETYTDEVRAMMESVRDNPITVAKSSNATGKTHGAARVAVWWYKTFPDSQVYTAAAPPESNLKKLLWGEI